MSEEIKTIVTIARHIRIVQACLQRLAHQLEQRGVGHDLSKLSNDEFDGFVQINQIAREHAYGSDEYRRAVRETGVVPLHYSRNLHHPEHHENDVHDMSLIDIIEMVCDWKAASEVYGQTSFQDSINISVERFNLTAEQEYVVRLIAKALEA